jgi:hypothetical protein
VGDGPLPGVRGAQATPCETLYEHTNDDLGRMKVDERNVYSYPFQTRNEPSEAEVSAWRKRTESVELA